LIEGSIAGSTFEFTKTGSTKDSTQLLSRLALKMPEFCDIPENAKQRDLTRWKWQVKELYKQWFDAVISFLIGIGFCYWNAEKNRAEYFPRKHLRVFNNDESKFP
jgi:hypothetical protein